MSDRFTPRGQSRIAVLDRIAPSWNDQTRAFIPLEGGDRALRPLPPLLLTYDEWAVIGKRMKWWVRRHDATSRERRRLSPLKPGYGPCSACGDGDTELKYHDHEEQPDGTDNIS